MGAKDSCKFFYEVLVDAVHEKKGPLDIFLLSTHCRFYDVDANLADHTELPYKAWTIRYICGANSRQEVRSLKDQT